MVYPFVQAFNDYGLAKGPRRGISWHMAEGGGTVGYLARNNPNGVSVHFVVEYSGRIVQMLQLKHMNGSLRPTAIRTTDDTPYLWKGVPIIYGASAAKAVLGEWATVANGLGPNHATIGVEIEGFAKDGPNLGQVAAMGKLYVDMRNQFPGIRSLAHRDFADYKGCPGKKIPWDQIGGHGQEESMQKFKLKDPSIGTYVLTIDTALIAMNASRIPVLKGRTGLVFANVVLPDLRPGFLVGYGDTTGILVNDSRCTFTPHPPLTCDDAIAEAITADRAKARIAWES